MRWVYLALGFLMVALGIVGAFLPIMPSTIFFILAAGFFAQSSPRLEQWLINHRQFGPAIRRWREHGAMSRKSKLFAWGGMALGYVTFYVGAQPSLPLAVFVAIFFLTGAVFVWLRPTMD